MNGIQAKPLQGKDAVRATLEAKISVARLRSLHSPDAAQRAAEAEKLEQYERKLAGLD